jgi:glyoxylase-like metal-dependent hydrolase (beta-lactamase superfamily II)
MAAQLTDGLWHVDCRTRDRPNVYVVDDGDCTLVDAGWPGDVETVREGLADAGFEPGDVDRVLLTHYDADHVGTLARLTPGLDAPVFVHRADAPYVAGDRLPPWTARNGLEALHRLYYRRLDLPDLPIREVGDGDEVAGFQVHHAPGHTPGHVVYAHEGVDAAFLGDLAYAMGDHLQPTGRLTSYDADQSMASIERSCDRLPGFEHACPGHGPPLADGAERLSGAVD